jgi:hypothetical protein
MFLRVIALATVSVLVAGTAAWAVGESPQKKIARALSAGPPSITARATVAEMDANGKMTVLRKGTNSWTCVPGHKAVVGDDPVCMDAAAMQWAGDWMAHKPKPTNTVPGIMYMYAGGTDWSADDPYATKGTPIKETVLICMDTYSRHFFLLLRRRFHREVILAASAFGSTG